MKKTNGVSASHAKLVTRYSCLMTNADTQLTVKQNIKFYVGYYLPYLLVSKNLIPKINSKVGGSSYTRNPTLSSSD